MIRIVIITTTSTSISTTLRDEMNIKLGFEYSIEGAMVMGKFSKFGELSCICQISRLTTKCGAWPVSGWPVVPVQLWSRFFLYLSCPTILVVLGCL